MRPVRLPHTGLEWRWLLARFARVDPRGLFTRNVRIKVAAISIALAVSLVAGASEPEVNDSFAGVPVERVNLPPGYVLRGTLGAVDVAYRAPVDPARKIGVTSFRAEVDLGSYELAQPGQLRELPVRVGVADSRVTVVQVRPSVVTVRLVPVESARKTVQVRFENQPPAGFQAREPSASPSEVTVRGPADSLREVVGVVVQVRFSDTAQNLLVHPRAVPLDAVGREVEGVETVPQSVDVTVMVEAVRPTRTVAVVPVIRGAPAAGYWVARVTTDPPVATVRGDVAALEGLDRLETQPISLGGASSDFVVRAPLALPTGITLARSAADVVVVVSIEPAHGTRAFPAVAVRPLNTARDVVVDLDPSALEVVLAGLAPTLLGVRPEQVVAVVDLSGKGPGVYQLEPSLQVPAGTSLLSIAPARVTAVVRARQ